MYYVPESEIWVKCYDNLNYSRVSVVHFRASRYIMGHTHTPESKVMAVGICRELPCSILRVSIYYAPQMDIRAKCYENLNFSWASLVPFRASRYIMGVTYTNESKVMAVWICRELHVEFQASQYIMRRNRRSKWNVMTIWISRELSFIIFKHIDMSWASHLHPSQKLLPFEFSESFRVQFRESRYIMSRNQRSEWNVMTIWISQELPWFIVERLKISWAWHIHLSKNLWLFEFAESFRVEFKASRYIMRLNQRYEWNVMTFDFLKSFHCSFPSVSIYHEPHTHKRVKIYGRLNFMRAYMFNFERIDILW